MSFESVMHIIYALGPYIGFMAVFSFVVVIHELGHFVAAKRCMVPVKEFSLGFPGTPIIWRFGQHRETLFTLRLLPFGGFVRFDEADDADGKETGNEQSFENLPPGKKVVILSAGGLVNLVIGFLLLVLAFMGIKSLSVFDSVMVVCDVMKMIVAGTYTTITNLDMSAMSGPVGAAVASQKVMLSGLMPVIGITGLMSFAIGIMNLLPFPGCDGFYICLAAVEAVRGKSINRRTHAIIGAAGFLFIISFMLVITYQDVVRIFAGNG